MTGNRITIPIGECTLEMDADILPKHVMANGNPVEIAFFAGMEVQRNHGQSDIEVCEYSQSMTKKECERLFDRTWKNIKTRVRYIEITSKMVQIHLKDLQKRW